MILGNIDKHYGNGLVAFLDILGFSNEITTRWGEKENNPLNKILELKEHLPVYTDRELENSKEREEKINRRVYPCRVQTISDSIVISFGFEEEPVYSDVFMATISFFHTISVIWRNTIEAGFTLRGAADWGEIFWNEKEIIGPSFINVYRLEQKIAKSSRVVVSSSLNRNLAKVYSETNTFWNDRILNFLKKDTDGHLILNPHTLYSEKENDDKQHLIKRIEALRDNTDQINKEKYSSLLANLSSKNKKLDGTDLGKY